MLSPTINFVNKLRRQIRRLSLDAWHREQAGFFLQFLDREDLAVIIQEAGEDTTADARIRVGAKRALRAGETIQKIMGDNPQINFGRF